MNNFLSLLIGALLAVIGGVLGDQIRSFVDRMRERKAIRISLCDELGEIESTVKNMHEVWEKSKILYPSYVADLVANTTAFDGLRQRLFLIKNMTLRKRIIAFYKNLKDLAKKSEGKLGSLADTADANAEQSGFATDFKTLGTEAKGLQEELS